MPAVAVEDWIDALEARGRYTFLSTEAIRDSGLSAEAVKKALQRLTRHKPSTPASDVAADPSPFRRSPQRGKQLDQQWVLLRVPKVNHGSRLGKAVAVNGRQTDRFRGFHQSEGESPGSFGMTSDKREVSVYCESVILGTLPEER